MQREDFNEGEKERWIEGGRGMDKEKREGIKDGERKTEKVKYADRVREMEKEKSRSRRFTSTCFFVTKDEPFRVRARVSESRRSSRADVCV